MALPPHGDPRRPLHLAVRSTRLLGAAFLLLGVCTPLPTLKVNPNVLELPWRLVAAAVTHLVPGALYLVCAALLGRQRRSAVIAAMGLVAVHCVSVLGSLTGFSVLLFTHAGNAVFLLFGVSTMLLVMAALGQLFFHLVRSLKVVTQRPVDETTAGESPTENALRAAA